MGGLFSRKPRGSSDAVRVCFVTDVHGWRYTIHRRSHQSTTPNHGPGGWPSLTPLTDRGWLSMSHTWLASSNNPQTTNGEM